MSLALRKDASAPAQAAGEAPRISASRSDDWAIGREPEKPSAGAAPSIAEGRSARIEFAGQRGEYGGITLRGLLLYIPTFGFYRFWLRTDQRRYLWLNASLEGSSFEYRGTARELVVGFLIAIAVYLPITIGYSLLGLYAETLQAFASIPFFIFTGLFGYYAAYRARRYRLSRTVYRGVRFWMAGSAWKFAFRGFLWLLFCIVTLGAAYPWMVAAMERIKVQNSYFGDLKGEFHGTGGQLLKALALPLVALLIGSFIPIVNIFVWLTMLPALGVITARWAANGAQFGPVRISSDIGNYALAVPALVTLLLIVLFGAVWMGLGWLVVQSAAPPERLARAAATLTSDWRIAVIGLGWSMLGLLGVGAIKSIFFDLEKVRRLLQSLSLSNLEALDTVEAKGEAAGAFGEGLADALGSDGF